MSTDSVVDMRNQWAVYWEKYSSSMEGNALLKDGVEIKVQVEKGHKASTDANSRVIAWDYEINVPHRLVDGSLLWLGRIDELTVPSFSWEDIEPPDIRRGFLEVVECEEHPDDTGLLFDRWVKCVKFGNRIRGSWLEAFQD